MSLLAGVVFGQVPPEVLKFNPQISGTSVEAAAKWKLIDLDQVIGGPAAGNKSYGINAGDFDSDGDLDLVVVFQSGGKDSRSSEKTHGAVYCLENESPRMVAATSFRVRLIDDQQFTPKVAVLGPKADKVHSVVVPCYLAGETILYQTSKDMKWTKTRLWSEGLQAPVRAVVADIDGDGFEDIVVTSIAQPGEHLAWFRQPRRGSSSWEVVRISEKLPALVGVDAGDVDADGDQDLVCASEHSPSPWLLLNLDGRGTKWKKRPLRVRSADSVHKSVTNFSRPPTSQNHVRLTDIDGDGDLDCVETSLKNGYVAWRENRGNAATWSFHAVAGRLKGAYCFDVGDVDCDGRPDLVVPAADAGGVYVFRNMKKGLQWEATLLGRRANLNWPNIIRLADLDADGFVDILATDWGRKAAVWMNPARKTTE